MSKEQLHDVLKLPTSEVERILQELAQSPQPSGSESARETKRWNLQFQKFVVTLIDENRTKKHLVVVPRDLSTNGVGFLHGGFLHPGSRCFVSMRGNDGKGRSIAGNVVRCRLVRQHVHEVGVKFDDIINPREFFIDAGEEYLFNAEQVNIEKLHGMVLVVAESRADQQLFQYHFQNSNLRLGFVCSGEEALIEMDERPDLVFVEYALPDMTGIDLVLAARDKGHMMPVIIMAATDDRELRHAAIAAGAKEMLFKPCPPDLLHRAAADFLLLRFQDGSEEETLECTASREEVSDEVLNAYILELREHGEILTADWQKGDVEALTKIAGRVAGSAGSFGFTAVARRAQLTVDSLERGDAPDASNPHIQRLVDACRRAIGRPMPTPTETPAADESADGAEEIAA